MREAKYQAWFDGEMISDWYPRTQFRICTGWDNKIRLETFSTMEEGIFNGEPVALPVWKSANGAKLRQYTGLHDKNGKEIYEGDIVTGKRDSHWHGGYDRVRGTAYFSDSHLAFRVDGIGGGWLHNVEEMEVIGNTYENPELLGV